MDFLRSIKEGLKNPKKKSITLLIIYFIFFVIVFILLGNSKTVTYENDNESNLDEPLSFESYNYKIRVTNNELTDEISGTYYLGNTLFNFKGYDYFIENDILYIIDNGFYCEAGIDYNITKLLSDNIYELLSSATLESTTTFKDESVITRYSISSKTFYKYYFDLETDIDTLVYIDVKKIDENNQNIVIDLLNLGTTLSKIEIEYSNINLINGLDFNRDNLIYRE